KMPNITGRMRVMAVIVEGDRYNAAQQDVTLTSPLLVETSWPRFAAPGDSFRVPVKLFNSTDAPLKAALVFESEGGIELSLADEDLKIDVNPNEPRTIWLTAKATALGPVKATITATAATADRALRASSEGVLAVRPITPLHVTNRLVRAKVGQPISIERSKELEPGSRLTLSISGNPSVELRPAVEGLLDYPYGCVEQTTSRLLAILYAPQLLSLETSDDVRIDEAKAMIAAGIARLWSMQTRSGGLSYWPGDPHPYSWGTMYAADFLLRAGRAGHKIDKRFLDELTKYLKSQLARFENGDEAMDANTRAQLLHLLAAFGQPDEAWMARLSEQLGELDIAGRANLAGAWFELGRRDKALALLPDDTLGMSIATSTGGRLSSQVRQEAVLLDTLLDLKPDHAWVPLLVQRLDKQRKDGHWGTTLNTASAIAALAKYQTLRRGSDQFTGTVHIGDSQTISFDQTKPLHVKLLDGDAVRIESQGKGDLYVTVSEQGLLKPELIKPFERNLRVTRKWLSREGQPIDPAMLKVGDLIHVEVMLAAPTIDADASVSNIAVVDALPTGLEVENPRLLTSAVDDDDSSAKPDRIEFLDDRVILFTSASKQARTFRYLLRVTTVGEFALPPVQASCMYDPAFAAMGERGVVNVK
ncbi:MAG: alpha-2-macroglobulin family protein, partial [Phycisphaeraceae bacterium]